MRPKLSKSKLLAKRPAEQVVKDIRRATRRHFSAEDRSLRSWRGSKRRGCETWMALISSSSVTLLSQISCHKKLASAAREGPPRLDSLPPSRLYKPVLII